MAAPIINNSPKTGIIGVPYSFTWDITADPAATTQIMGELPPGLVLSDNINNNNPVISGTPDATGTYGFQAYVTNNEITIKDYVIIIRPPIFRGFYNQE